MEGLGSSGGNLIASNSENNDQVTVVQAPQVAGSVGGGGQPIITQVLSGQMLGQTLQGGGMPRNIILLPISNLGNIQGTQLLQTMDGQTFIYQPMTADGSSQGTQSNILGLNGPVIPFAQASGAATVNYASAGSSVTHPQTVTLGGTNFMVQSSGVSGGVPQRTRMLQQIHELLGEEPIYVNQKQYHRIIKRREARARLESQGRIPKERLKYQHESRHRHAMNRIRGEGGRFSSRSADGDMKEDVVEQSHYLTETKQELVHDSSYYMNLI